MQTDARPALLKGIHAWVLLASLVVLLALPVVAFANGTVAGNVKDADTGQNLSGVSIVASQGGTVKGSTTTNASGNYSLSLPAGSYTITASASTHQTGDGSAWIDDLVSTPENFSLVPYLVSGSVSKLGTPTDDLCATVTECTTNSGHVKVSLYRGGTFVRSVFADTGGGFEFRGITAATYSLKYTHPDYLTRTSPDLVVSDGAPQRAHSGSVPAIVTGRRRRLDVIVDGTHLSRGGRQRVSGRDAATVVSILQQQGFTSR